jgi:hypothetical protein
MYANFVYENPNSTPTYLKNFLNQGSSRKHCKIQRKLLSKRNRIMDLKKKLYTKITKLTEKQHGGLQEIEGH